MSDVTVLPTFESILQHNAAVDISLTTAIAEDLKNGRVSSFVQQMQPVLVRMGIGEKEVAALSKGFMLLETLPFKDWLSILLPLMTNLIGKTDTAGQAFFAQQQFPWVAAVESRWSLMMSEIEVALSRPQMIPAFQEIQPEQTNLTNDNLWKVILFRGYGDDMDTNQQAFPQVSKTLDLIPGCSTAMVSILAPGKHIRPHTGLYKGVLRYHLGLQVPDDCAIKVKGITKSWQPGKSLIFDDTFEHEAWNRSNSHRAVLFVDFLRPLIFPFNLVNELIGLHLIKQSHFITDAKQNLHKYSELVNYLKSEQ